MAKKAATNKSSEANESKRSANDISSLAISLQYERSEFDVPPGYSSKLYSIRLNDRQAAAAKVLTTILCRKSERVESGRPSVHPDGVTVELVPDAVRWLFRSHC